MQPFTFVDTDSRLTQYSLKIEYLIRKGLAEPLTCKGTNLFLCIIIQIAWLFFFVWIWVRNGGEKNHPTSHRIIHLVIINVVVTTKDMQLTLKNIMGKVEVQNFDQRLGIIGYDSTQIGKFRNQCKNIKLRHMYLRLVNRDFYTKERMLRFRMSLSDACERCGEVETYKQLFWECGESGRVWRRTKSPF